MVYTVSFFTEKASNGDFIKFDDSTINQPKRMKIVGQYSVVPSMYMGQQKTTQKGQPISEAHVPVELEDGTRATFSDSGKWRLQSAVGAAVQQSGAPDLEIGGILTVTYVGKTQTKGGQMANDYRAEYERPQGGGEPAQGAAQPQPEAQQQPAAVASAPANNDPWSV